MKAIEKLTIEEVSALIKEKYGIDLTEKDIDYVLTVDEIKANAYAEGYQDDLDASEVITEQFE